MIAPVALVEGCRKGQETQSHAEGAQQEKSSPADNIHDNQRNECKHHFNGPYDDGGHTARSHSESLNDVKRFILVSIDQHGKDISHFRLQNLTCSCE